MFVQFFCGEFPLVVISLPNVTHNASAVATAVRHQNDDRQTMNFVRQKSLYPGQHSLRYKISFLIDNVFYPHRQQRSEDSDGKFSGIEVVLRAAFKYDSSRDM